MSQKTSLKFTLLTALLLLSLGGWLIHFKAHSPAYNPANFIPFIAGILSVIIVPWLLAVRKTIHYGYLLNGMIVIIGIVTMAHYSIANWPDPMTWKALLFRNTLPDILILGTKFFIGQAIFELELFNLEGEKPKGKYFRYPHNGFWLAHLAGFSLVYYFGSVLARWL